MSRRYSVAGPWINDGTLPPDWEEMVDSETGKSYFVDHNLKITSWVDPRDLFMKPEKFEECADGGFALGWERAVDPLAGEYFVNHNTWETTFEDPRLPPAQRTRLPIQAQDLMDESIGPLSARTSVYHEQDELYEQMGEFIKDQGEQSKLLQDRVEELEDELRNKSASGRYDIAVDVTGEKARVKELEAQMASMMAQTQSDIEATTESFMSKQKANSRFRKQQQEIDDMREMLKASKSGESSKRVWEDNLQSFVAVNTTTQVKTAGRGNNNNPLSKANVKALDNETRKSAISGVQMRPKRERRNSSPRRRLSRYNSESGASDIEYEAMTAEMDRLEDMKRSHQSRIKELRDRPKAKGTSNRAKLLSAASNLGNAVGEVTESRTSFGESN